MTAEGNIKRTAAQVNAKYDVTGKAQHAAEQLDQNVEFTKFHILLLMWLLILTTQYLHWPVFDPKISLTGL